MKILIGCKEATMIMVMGEEKKLLVSGKLKLLIHLLLCKFCRLFQKQNKHITDNIKNIYSEKKFSGSEKENLIKILKSSL